MGNIIYVLKSCDIWKTNSSMGDITYTTNLKILKKAIEEELKQNNMEYDGDFSSDFDKFINDDCLVKYIDTRLKYGYLMCIYDGEIL